ncbi:density-regulated protein DRP1 [Aureobasidium namibiae CBS 147.97]|uniref:Translation machinery-associated protein 22 n=1 Tax=Aureobasidium namibiae CBS 147.97 TaxID=1043004 RepID=A0A074W5W7_9PEZI
MSETAILPPKQVVYCGVCSLPPEYCEFGGTTKKCEEWLESKHPDLHTKLYSEDAVAANLSTLSLDAQKRAEKDAKKKEAKATAAEARRAEELATSKITIKRVERNKRKHVTEVSGLEAFNIDIKKLAKELGKKFATGSSAGKMPGGVGEVITIQGDLSDEVGEWICEKYEQVPEDNVEFVEDKKKKNKAEPPMVAPQ